MNILHLILTIIPAICFGGCVIPQVLRLRKTGSARDISFVFISVLFLGVTSVLILMFITPNSWWVKGQQLINFAGSTTLWIWVLIYKSRDKRKYANMRKNLRIMKGR